MVGADPSFTDVHVMRALFILDSGVPGRKKLVKLLGVGEGSVRTIIKRLSQREYLSSSKLGHSLTAKGKAAASTWLSKMSKPLAFESGGLVSGQQSAVVVYGAAPRVGGGVHLRDLALKAGADGAVILVYSGGLRFPDSMMDLGDYPDARVKFSSLSLKDGDVVVVGFASSTAKAEDGALACALNLVEGVTV